VSTKKKASDLGEGPEAELKKAPQESRAAKKGNKSALTRSQPGNGFPSEGSKEKM